jgi:Carbohydrate/starch-binding module (family 21)
MNAVALLYADAVVIPAADNGEAFATNFAVVVQNLADDKIVGIWGDGVGGTPGTWSFAPCSYSRSVPGNLEIWVPDPAEPLATPSQFAVRYQALGNAYWDNNAGYNYRLDPGALDLTPEGIATAVIGPNVVAVSGGLNGPGLIVEVLVKNIAFQKQVGIIYTTDNWQTYQNAFGVYSQSLRPGGTPHQLNAEQWNITATVGSPATGQYAVFYDVAGATYWDNNFGLNYSF